MNIKLSLNRFSKSSKGNGYLVTGVVGKGTEEIRFLTCSHEADKSLLNGLSACDLVGCISSSDLRFYKPSRNVEIFIIADLSPSDSNDFFFCDTIIEVSQESLIIADPFDWAVTSSERSEHGALDDSSDDERELPLPA